MHRGNSLLTGLFPLFSPAGEMGGDPHGLLPSSSRLSLLLFWQVCLLASVAGILSWRYPWPGLTLFGLILWLDRPRSAGRAQALCLAVFFVLSFCYTGLREPVPPPVPPWLADAAFTGENAAKDGNRPGPVRVTANVLDATPLPGNRLRVILADLRPADGSGQAYAGRAVWTWHGPAQPLIPGDTLTADLRLAAQHGMRNPGVWDTDRYWHDRKVWLRAYAAGTAGMVVHGAPDGRQKHAWARIRQRLSGRFFANLPAGQDGKPQPGSGASLLPALIFGDRSLITPELVDRFARSTLAHSLALSGMHLGFAVLAGLATASLLGRLWPGLWLRVTRPLAALLLSLPFTGLYLWLGGAPVSLMRAACMLLFWTALLLLQRPRVLLDGLCATVAFLLLLNPPSLFDVSLQLSALSVAAIALALPLVGVLADGMTSRLFAGQTGGAPGMHPPRAGYTPVARAVRTGCVLVGLSLAIQIALLPLVARLFGTSGLLFPLNLVWLPVLGAAVLPLAFAGLGLTALGLDGPAALVLHLAALPCEGLLALLSWLDGTGWLVSPALPRPHWLTIAGYWLVCLALPVLVMGRRRAGGAAGGGNAADGRKNGRAAWLPVCLAGFVCLCAPPLWAHAQGKAERVRVTVLDVGQGQAVVVEWGGKKAGRLLVDGGGFASPFFDVGKAIVAPALTDNALPRLDAVIASHPDTDHLGGLLFILERFGVGRYFGNGAEALPSLAARERAALADKGLNRERLQAGDRLALAPDLVLETLWPTPEARAAVTGKGSGTGREKSNNISLVQRLIWKGRPLLLLCGDAESAALAALLQRGGDLAAPVLVLPHHGSAGSLEPGFYEAVAPRLALGSSGFGNRWGFPAATVRRALEALGIPLLTTARSGQIRVEWDSPETFRVSTGRK